MYVVGEITEVTLELRDSITLTYKVSPSPPGADTVIVDFLDVTGNVIASPSQVTFDSDHSSFVITLTVANTATIGTYTMVPTFSGTIGANYSSIATAVIVNVILGSFIQPIYDPIWYVGSFRGPKEFSLRVPPLNGLTIGLSAPYV
jgi:hypothetical protein